MGVASKRRGRENLSRAGATPPNETLGLLAFVTRQGVVVARSDRLRPLQGLEGTPSRGRHFEDSEEKSPQ